MQHRRQRTRRLLIGLAAVPLAAQAAAAQLTATWQATSGNYATAGNWDLNTVPLNNASNTYIVQIGSGKTVTYNTTGAQSIDQLLLDGNSAFNLSSSSLVFPTSLTVLGQALIGGAVSASQASFSALAAGTNFVGNKVSLSATNGGVIRIAATDYSARGFTGGTILNAAGQGSALELASLQTLDSGTASVNFAFTNTVAAADKASINLSGVKSVVAPASGSNALAFSVVSGASLNLSALQQIAGLTLDTGNTSFSADNGSVLLGPLQKANRVAVNLKNGSTMSAGGFAGVADISNSSFVVSGGSALNAATLKGNYSVRGFTGATLLSASGVGSLLDLSGIQTLDGGSGNVNFAYTNSVLAADQARINLAGVKTIVAPASGSNTLAFSAIGGASVDLSAVQQISGVTLDSGRTSFSADSGSFVLGALQKANRVDVNLKNASVLSVGGFAGSADISNSTFVVASGSRLDGATLKGSYSVRGFTGATLLSAAGANSVLDLSGLQTLDSGAPNVNFAYTNTVAAADQAKIRLSGLTTLVAPTANANALAFSANSGASIDLSALQQIAGFTLDTGRTTFTADAASFVVGPVQKANRISVNLQHAATMALGGFSGAADISNSTFAVASGSQLNAAALKGDYSVRGFTGGTVLSASGAGSLLDLSGLRLLDSGAANVNFAYTNTVAAADKARIDLSGVKTLVAPSASANALAFSATSGGVIDLSQLQQTAGLTLNTGNTNVGADAGTVLLGPLQKANRLFVNLQNGSLMTVGGYGGVADISNSTFTVAGGSRLDGATLKGDYSVRGFTGGTVLSASGAGSVLDLSGLRSIDSGAANVNFAYVNTLAAADGAQIKLAGVTAVATPQSASNALTFSAVGKASIDLSALQTFSNPGQLNFNVNTGGSMQLHGMSAGQGVHFNLADADSTLAFGGSLALLSGSTAVGGAGTRISTSGSFSFQQTVESQVNLELATLQLVGSAPQTLEVGGKRLATLSGVTLVHDNFALGQLQVGRDGVAGTVTLVDAIDNGNRSSPEVLYLNGGTGVEGLRILGGSTLVLAGLDVYALHGGQWSHINDLFTAGQTTIAYDQGFIRLDVAAVPEPGSLALLLAGLGAIALRRRRLAAPAP